MDTVSSPTDYGVPSAVDNEGGGTLNTVTRPINDGVPSAVDSEGGGTLNTVTRPTDDGVPSAVDSEGGGTLNTVTSPTDAASGKSIVYDTVISYSISTVHAYHFFSCLVFILTIKKIFEYNKKHCIAQ